MEKNKKRGRDILAASPLCVQMRPGCEVEEEVVQTKKKQ